MATPNSSFHDIPFDWRFSNPKRELRNGAVHFSGEIVVYDQLALNNLFNVCRPSVNVRPRAGGYGRPLIDYYGPTATAQLQMNVLTRNTAGLVSTRAYCFEAILVTVDRQQVQPGGVHFCQADFLVLNDGAPCGSASFFTLGASFPFTGISRVGRGWAIDGGDVSLTVNWAGATGWVEKPARGITVPSTANWFGISWQFDDHQLDLVGEFDILYACIVGFYSDGTVMPLGSPLLISATSGALTFHIFSDPTAPPVAGAGWYALNTGAPGRPAMLFPSLAIISENGVLRDAQGIITIYFAASTSVAFADYIDYLL